MSEKHIEMQMVESSNIRAIGYDKEEKTLFVQFKNYNEFSFEGVPKETHDALMAAESVGKYFHSHIKGKFKTTRV